MATVAGAVAITTLLGTAFVFNHQIHELWNQYKSRPGNSQIQRWGGKGCEIHSWKNGPRWCFNLLPHTNRKKPRSWIQSNEWRLASLADLEGELLRVPTNTTVVWYGDPATPAEVVFAIKRRCKKQGLELYFP